MTSLRAIARPLLASVFVVDGWDAVRHPDRHSEKLGAVARPIAAIAEKIPGVPSDTASLTRLTGAVSVGAGVLLATGRTPRLAAGLLALVAVPLTAFNRPDATSEEERREQKRVMLRNAALVGALIIAAGDREGQPSLRWRAQNAREHRAELAELRSDLRARIKEAKAA